MALLAPVVQEKRGATAPLLHVTDVLSNGILPDTPEFRAACERGSRVHQITEDFDRGLILQTEKGWEGWLAAWRSFLGATGAEVLEIERSVGGEKLGYIGRLDRVLRIGKETWIADIKSGGPWPTYALQTAAYEHAYRSEHLPKNAKRLSRCCVHLREDGTYDMKIHKNVHDLNTFLAALRWVRWQISVGIRKPPKERS